MTMMTTPPVVPIGSWLAQLIQAHLEELAAGLGDAARQQIPLYRALDPALVQLLFTAFYQVLAQTFALNDIMPMRRYLENVTSDRIRDGASAAAFIQLAAIGATQLNLLLAQAAPDDPHLIREATRHLQSVNTQVRLILSEINLHLATHVPPTSPPALPSVDA